jgi:hypothetical protein
MALWRTPKGSFIRHRYDWQLAAANFGCAIQNAAFSNTSVVSLYNNDSASRAYAVVAVMAWVSYWNQLATWDVRQGSEGSVGSPNVIRAVDPRNPIISGQILQQSVGGGDASNPAGLFLADGKTVLERAGAPIAIVPPGYRFRVWNSNWPNVAYAANPLLAVTFWWSYY